MKIGQGLKAGWVAITLVLLTFTCLKVDSAQNRDLDLLLTWSMILLCFPSSLLGISINASLGFGAHEIIAMMPRWLQICLTWAVFFVLGYVQWFILLPTAFQKWRRRKVVD
jgi:hypothetical protein